MSARRGHDLRLAPLALAAWVAAWWMTGPGVAGAATTAVVSLGAALVALAVLVLLRIARTHGTSRRSQLPHLHGTWRRPAAAHLLLVLACVGAVAGGVHVQSGARAPLDAATGQEATATLHGVVVSEPRPARFGDGTTFTLAVQGVDARGVGSVARGHVEVTAPGTAPRYGAEAVVRGRLGPPGIGAGTAATASSWQPVTETAPPGVVLRATDRMRAALLEVTDGLSAQARGLVPGAAIGDTTRVPDPLDTAMRVSGLTHVTAVSGSHFAIVLAVATALLVTCGCPRGVRVVVLAVVAVAFVVLVRPEPSVLRAAWTCGVALLALALGRPAAGLPALATASTLLLVVDPWQARSFGFALSCAATAGIVLLTGPLARRLAPWCGRAAAFAIAVPVAAQVTCGPVLVLLDPAVPVMSVPANVLAAPALVPATVLGLTATVLAPWSPGPAGVVAWLAGIPTGWIAAVATFFAGLPGARLPWWSGPGGALALAAVTAVVLGILLSRPPARGWADRSAAMRRRMGATVRQALRPGASTTARRALPGTVVAAVLLPVVLGGAAVLVAPRVVAPGSLPTDWQVVACDVGQGDTLVVRSGQRSAVVIDTGPPGDAAGRCLDRLGVERVDLLVLSHFHTDHVGGLDAAIAGREVGPVLVSAVPEPAGPSARALAVLDAAGATVTTGRPGQSGQAGTVAWQVLGAARGVGANDASVAVALRTVDGVDVVALGDLEEAGQDRLAVDLEADGFPRDTVEVVKMAHHGSASQSPRLARLLAPHVVLVTVGENDYGHPTRAALDLYARLGARAVRTDDCGTAALTVRGGGLRLSCGPP